MTGRRHVGEDLRLRVIEAVNALKYRPNQVAASLRNQRTRTVGVVVPDLTNPFFSEFVKHIEALATAAGFQLLLVTSGESRLLESQRVHDLVARQIDGLIIAPAQDDTSGLSAPTMVNPPTVLVDRAPEAKGFDTVLVDNKDAGYRGARHLLELGHRDIGLLMISDRLSNIQGRIAGYRRALAEWGEYVPERLIVGGLATDDCRNALLPILGRPDRPTAIFATGYVATLGAVQAIRVLNLRFPEEISLLGFDDFEWMTALRPYVSTIRQPIEEIAERAWSALTGRLSGNRDDFKHIRLRCSLEARESTLCFGVQF
jgi:LacI family transcriptional regulator